MTLPPEGFLLKKNHVFFLSKKTKEDYMKYRITYTTTDSKKDNFIVEGNNTIEVGKKSQEELRRIGGKFPHGEEITE